MPGYKQKRFKTPYSIKRIADFDISLKHVNSSSIVKAIVRYCDFH